MFKSKSFRINHEIDKKPRVHELLYEPKRIRWIKFFVIPLLIAFSLLLVLSNVNFSGESYELVVAPSGESHAIPTQMPTTEVITMDSIDYDILAEEVGLDSVEGDNGSSALLVTTDDGEDKKVMDVAAQYWNEALAVVPAKSFTCDDNRKCETIICSGGPINKILDEMDYFIKWCGNNENRFDVIIEDCSFNKNTISEYTFSGNFKMSSLTIRNCQLDTIVDNAFKLQSVNELTNLTLAGVQLKALNAQTFIGLEAVKNLQLFNVLTQATSPLNAINFLQPMAASLSNLVFQQTEESCSSNIIYDPTGWLGGTTLYSKLLYVDLSGTNFYHTLNGNTFSKLLAVQELRLTNCSLSMIAENVFNAISATLTLLDLRYNRLKTLDGEFLATAVVKGINIEFGGNWWSCDCDNVENIEYMKQVKNNSAAETVCATPTELQSTQIRYAQLRCYDATTLTTFKTTRTSTTATTTTTSEPTTIMTMTTTTDETTLQTTETHSETQPTSTTTDTDVSENTDLTPHSTINTTTPTVPTTSDNTTTPNSSTMFSTTTNETIAPPSSLMTSTIEDDSTMETTESTTIITPQSTSTTLIIFPGTTIIPVPTTFTTDTTKTTETTTNRIKTTEVENTTIKETTTSVTTLASIPPIMTSCFRNKSPKFLVCTDIIAIKLCDFDVAFNVVPLSSRSVQLQIGGNATGLQAIYFQVLINSIIKDIENDNNRNIEIDNLAPNSSYTFCLIPKEETSTSPFNCRSAHLPLETTQPWLDYNDIVLFCTIAITITIVCVIVAGAFVYFLLRWRPTLLYGNKRLRRIASTSHEVLLFPKPERSSVDSKTCALNELSKMHSSISDSLTPENYLNIKSYDYMQYFKDAKLEKQRKVAHISLNQPPVHRAPALPPSVGSAAAHRGNGVSYLSGHLPGRQISQQSTIVLCGGAATRLPSDPVDVLENEYESLDYYQELY